MKTIALLTDFGYGEYVGIMKGVIMKESQCLVNIIDITHSIEPQNILQASWILSTAVPYFPKGTIFVCVVDPGVGGKRNSIMIQTKDYILIGPNNGIFTHTIHCCQLHIEHIYELNTKHSSNTFQGRDVFSKNAGLYCKQFNINDIDGKVNDSISLVELSLHSNIHLLLNDIPSKTLISQQVQIVSIDSFGNLITDYFLTEKNSQERDSIKDITSISSQSQVSWKIHFCSTYEEGNEKGFHLICLIGSNNTFEISIVNGNAQKELGLTIGDILTLQ